MPFISSDNVADRSLGSTTDMHPTLSGRMILEPDDVLEGRGLFTRLEKDRDPVGWTLGKPESPDGRHVYVGTSPATTTRQTHSPIASNRLVHLVNYALQEFGARPPKATTPLLARIPRSEAPILKAIPVTMDGYPASEPLSPYWYSWAAVKNGKLTKIAPPVPFHLANGQPALVTLPEDVPEGVHEIALLLSEPNASRPTSPGRMRVQRIVDLRRYFLTTYPLTGPYRYDARLAPSANETRLDRADAPRLRRKSANVACRPGKFLARITWADKNGEALPSAESNVLPVQADARWTIYDDERENITTLAGGGLVEVIRPEAPAEAEGWRAYVYITPTHPSAGYSAGWRRIYDRKNNFGDAQPFPLSYGSVKTAGWSGDEHYGANDHLVAIDASLPEENTTGVRSPEDAPEAPVPFGASRPEADRYSVRTTDTVGRAESLPSPASSISIASDEIFSVHFPDRANRFANATFVETDPSNLPLHWNVDTTGGSADVVARRLVVKTNGAQAGATPFAHPDGVDVNPQRSSYVDGEFSVDSPDTGAISGSVWAVLRQYDAAGALLSATLLKAASEPGEHEFRAEIRPAGSQGLAWHASAAEAHVLYRFDGASKNLGFTVHHTILRDHRHKPRRPKRRKLPPETPAIPTSAHSLMQDPPEPPWSPECDVVVSPDRPLSAGTLREAVSYDAGIPAGHNPVASGGGSVTTSLAAAIAGAQGLHLTKAVSGALAKACTGKTYAPSGGRAYLHDAAQYVRTRFATWPVNGRLSMHALCDPATKNPFAWLEASTSNEIAELVIENAPLAGGSVGITLDKATTNVAVNAVPEVAELSITSAPTSPGTVAVTLDGRRFDVYSGGDKQIFKLTVTAVPSTSGYASVRVDGVTRNTLVGPTFRDTNGNLKASTPSKIAQDIQNTGYTGYTVVRSGPTLTFVANSPGTRQAPTFSAGTTRMTAALSVVQPGAPETAEELAARIRATAYPGWTTSQGASGANVVRFTAVTGGPRGDASYSPRTTGAAGTMATVTQGVIDTAAELAARIRATAFTGWTTSGTGTTVRFTATSPGPRQNAVYLPRATRATGTMKTPKQGANSDVTLYVEEADGTVTKRKVLRNVGAAAVINTDVSVSGANTKRAVVTLWGSLGAEPLRHLARFEDVDLTNVRAGHHVLGVFDESSPSLTWDVHVDEVGVTDRGLSYFRDHDPDGRWLKQVFGYYDPSQPVRQDLLLQGGRAPVLPGKTYTLSAFVRADNAHPTVPLRPLVATAYGPNPNIYHELGDVTNSPGLLGESGWTEHKLTFAVPERCYEIGLASRDVGPAEVAVQEVVCSPGPVPLRTGRYKTTGSHTVTYSTRTPRARDRFRFWTSQRINLGSATDEPEADTTIVTQYRSANADPLNPDAPDPKGWSPFTANPAAVPDRDFVQVSYAAQGPGTRTPAIASGSPYLEYVLKVTSTRRMSTFLRPDRTEFPGGAAFRKLRPYSRRNAAGRTRMPSGELRDDPQLFRSVGHLPGSELLVFEDAARLFIENNWRLPFVVEQYGEEALTVLLSEQPEFERESVTVEVDGQRRRRGVWVAKLAASQVVQTTDIP